MDLLEVKRAVRNDRINENPLSLDVRVYELKRNKADTCYIIDRENYTDIVLVCRISLFEVGREVNKDTPQKNKMQHYINTNYQDVLKYGMEFEYNGYLMGVIDPVTISRYKNDIVGYTAPVSIIRSM